MQASLQSLFSVININGIVILLSQVLHDAKDTLELMLSAAEDNLFCTVDLQYNTIQYNMWLV